MKHLHPCPLVPSSEGRRPVRGLRILVVESHPDMRLGLEVFLEALGHRPQFAPDLRGALEAAGAVETFDLLLIDVWLPDGDGRDLPGLLERTGRRPPHAIAMSGFRSADDAEKSHAAGFRAHVVKPGAPGEWEAALNGVAAW